MRPKGNDDRDQCYAAWVGFDWGDQEHVWVLQWADTGQRERGRLEQTPEALDVWIGQLMSRLNGRRIGIAIEQKHGAVVWMLLKYECVEIYPVHPKRPDNFVKLCIRPEARVIRPMGSCCSTCWYTIAIAFILWSKTTNPLVDCCC
jgi:hypothetical protein